MARAGDIAGSAGMALRCRARPRSAMTHAHAAAPLAALLCAALPAQNCTNTSIGAVPLMDLGTGTYQGHAGGLYGGGQNTPPAAHLASGLARMAAIAARDAAGAPAAGGRRGLEAIAGVSGGFPAAAQQLQGLLGQIVRNLRVRYPNVQLCFVSSRTYAGYATTTLNPEPYAYESGFAVQWLIAQQAAGDPLLNCDPAAGPVVAPWLGWGPYLW